MVLNDKYIKSCKPGKTAVKIADGGCKNLSLMIHPNGSLYWKIRYYRSGVAKESSLGQYPDVSLASARERTNQMRADLAKGIDPKEERESLQQKLVEEKEAEEKRRGETFALMAWWADFIDCLREGRPSPSPEMYKPAMESALRAN